MIVPAAWGTGSSFYISGTANCSCLIYVERRVWHVSFPGLPPRTHHHHSSHSVTDPAESPRTTWAVETKPYCQKFPTHDQGLGRPGRQCTCKTCPAPALRVERGCHSLHLLCSLHSSSTLYRGKNTFQTTNKSDLV